jgi:polar amino acid transport system substrate-binding protein
MIGPRAALHTRRLAGLTTKTFATAAGLALLAALSACSDQVKTSDAGTAQPAPTVDPVLHRALPPSVLASGILRVATDASYAPASSFAKDGRTIIGFEPDLGAALGAVLGVKVVFANKPFSALPGLLTSGATDLVMSAMTDTIKREKVIDFVDYFSAGTSLLVQRGNPHAISDLLSLCGQKVAAEAGTTQQDLLKRSQSQCSGNPIHVVLKPTNDDAILQLRTGQVAALLMDFPPAKVLTTDPRTHGLYQLASDVQYEPGLYGIGIAKSNPMLRDIIRIALSQLITSGDYTAVLKNWDVAKGAVKQVSVNAG